MKETLEEIKIRGEVENSGEIVALEMTVSAKGKTYLLSIATHFYLDRLRAYNRQFDSEHQLFENMLPVESLSDIDDVKNRLRDMPWDVIAPYLIEQDEQETTA